ncbi:MAG TPA: WhiB family transcriptional regulator [Acidimicrobiales bacterium]|nr:WhiB family transcriptional regulator [Acidimicrobiales bacterium]
MFAEVQFIETDADEQPGSDVWSLAACNDGSGALTELFFSEDLLDIARAKHICSGCPVQGRCLNEAIERREPWGVWGGELLVNGRILPQKRRRGRPPKQRPAEVIVIDGVEVVVVPAIQSA